MARIRTIKPAFFRHRRLYLAEKETGLPLRVAFAGLWTVADREGRFRWEPEELKLDCLPYDDVEFLRVLDALLTRGFIIHYVCEDREFGVIPGFKDHQVINNREAPSAIPNPPQPVATKVKPDALTTRAPRVDDASSTPLESAQVEGKGREEEREGKDVVVDRGKSVFCEADFDLTDRIMRAWGIDKNDPRVGGTTYFAKKWADEGWQADLIVATIGRVVATKRGDPPNNLRYFEKAIADAHAELARPLPVASATGPPSRRRRTFADLTMDLENRINERSDADPSGKFIVIDGTADAPADGEPVSEADVARQRAKPG